MISIWLQRTNKNKIRNQEHSYLKTCTFNQAEWAWKIFSYCKTDNEVSRSYYLEEPKSKAKKIHIIQTAMRGRSLIKDLKSLEVQIHTSQRMKIPKSDKWPYIFSSPCFCLYSYKYFIFKRNLCRQNLLSVKTDL